MSDSCIATLLRLDDDCYDDIFFSERRIQTLMFSFPPVLWCTFPRLLSVFLTFKEKKAFFLVLPFLFSGFCKF